MNRDRLSRHLLIAFVLALGLYVFGYWFIESRRVVHTPWQVGFQTHSEEHIELEVWQESLDLGPVTIRLKTPATNPPSARQEIRFDTPRPVPFDVPGGQCLFQDTTFLPGTVVLEISGIKIQMLPRVLTIGTNEFPWQKDSTIIVAPDETPKRLN